MVSHASQSDRRIVGTPAEAASMDRPSRRALRLHPDDNQSPLGGLALISRFLWDKKRCQEPFRGAWRVDSFLAPAPPHRSSHLTPR